MMNIIDTVWFKVVVFLICLGLIFIKCDAIAGEAKPPAIQHYVAPETGDFVGAIPPQVHMQRIWTPERGLVYHQFSCGNYEAPAWSILMTPDGRFIVGSPEAIVLRQGFLTEVFKTAPVQLFGYEPCLDHGDRQ